MNCMDKNIGSYKNFKWYIIINIVNEVNKQQKLLPICKREDG